MTIQDTHSENNDWQEPANESSTPSVDEHSLAYTEVSGNDMHSAEANAQSADVPSESVSHEQTPVLEEAPAILPAEEFHSPETPSQEEQQTSEVASPEASPSSTDESDVPSFAEINGETTTISAPTEASSHPLQEEHQPESFHSEEEAPRPFTELIEEFRQAEARWNALHPENKSSFATIVVDEAGSTDPSFLPDILTTSELFVANLDEPFSKQEQAPLGQTETVAPDAEIAPAANVPEIPQVGLTQPTLSSERPVSPLLRPATRIRLPRHNRHRIEEMNQPVELPVEQLKPIAEPVTEQEMHGEESFPTEQPPARPARRYRFDRPATAASTATANSKNPAAALPARNVETSTRTSELREKRSGSYFENGLLAEPAAIRANGNAPLDATAQITSTPEAVPASTEVYTLTPPPSSISERRRRSGQERQREKEPIAAAPIVPPAPAPAPEPIQVEIEQPEPVASMEMLDVPVEDLPPLEYSELQAANSRRRRRRRTGSTSSSAASNVAMAPKIAAPEILSPQAPTTPAPVPAQPKNAPAAAAAANYNIVSGYTVNQMNQGNDGTGPFMGPEPSPARGSGFTTPTPVPHTRSEALRGTVVHPTKHTETPLLSAAAVNHLGNTVSQAIQAQTDRMIAELRRANQVPTNISVTLPPFPSTERVGVFVDVANLLYSARTLRMTIDFGKLLDFLRGNRRLVRAQAYCPTSPQAGDEQMFLQAVKGLGYRITTKNYKTFSSGAKKADLDLDLCMDVVRLVDGSAVDCIVLVSGDSDFMPMLDYCSDHGVRVEVAAFDESMSATLRQSCDLFVNLSMLEEIRS